MRRTLSLAILFTSSLSTIALAGRALNDVSTSFPLIPTSQESGGSELPLLLVEEELAELLERNHASFRDVALPGGRRVDMQLERIDLDALDIGIHLNGREVAGGIEPWGLSVWTGVVVGSPDSEVALSFSRFGCQGWLRENDLLTHLVSEAHPTEGWSHARTRWMDDELMRELGGEVGVLCANDEFERRADPAGGQTDEPAPEPRGTTQFVGNGSTYMASIAVESDYQYFQVFGDVNAAGAYVVTLFAWVSNRYRIQVGTTLTLPYINFYDTPADPWTTPDTGGNCIDMIYEFQAAWLGNVPLGADIGHYLSGANLGCGVAFIEGLCDANENFSVSGNGSGTTQFPVAPNDANLDFYLVCHELGHNFGAIHTHDYCPPIDECASSGYFGPCQTQQACTYPGTLMSYCHGCGGFSNITTWFHEQSALDMRAWVESTACLPTFCPAPDTYCTSQQNSDGCIPAIAFSGSPSLSGPDDFHITAPAIVSNKSGMLFYGFAPTEIPIFVGATLCVQSPLVRTPVLNSGGSNGIPCDGSFDFFWSQAFSGASSLDAGTTLYAQFWYRDPVSASGSGLTDAIEFTLCP